MDAEIAPQVNEVLQNDLESQIPKAPLEKPELLPLDAPERVAAFRSRGKTYRHIFRRLTAADWEAFFAHVVAEFRQEKAGVSQVVDTDYASIVLYGRAILRAEGYHTSNGRAPHELPSWPECVPQHHRLAAVDLLMNAGLAEAGDDSMIFAEGVMVGIDALWNETAPGTMKQHRGLLHRFSSPTAEHRRRFLRAKNRSVVAGGSRNGTTMIPSAHPVLVALYDELILSTQGYGVSGRELASRGESAREMDAFHKAVSVARLFRTATPIDEEQAQE